MFMWKNNKSNIRMNIRNIALHNMCMMTIYYDRHRQEQKYTHPYLPSDKYNTHPYFFSQQFYVPFWHLQPLLMH